jgi:outer membrane protein TolC
MNTSITSLIAGALLAMAGVGSVAGQELRELSMDQAVEEALAKNRRLAVAEVRAEAAAAGVRGADAFLWPALGVEASTVRTNDPVGVFGTKLRQGRFAMSDLDIEALNHPDAVSDWSAAAGVRWAIADLSSWAGRDAARSEADAARWGASRAREGTAFRTRALYLDAVRLNAQLESAVAAEDAARGTLDLIRRRRDEGSLMDADVLQAEAELQGAEAARIFAQQMEIDARVRLAVFLGWEDGALPVPTDALTPPDPGVVVEGIQVGPLSDRSDIRALDSGLMAAEARARGASRSWAPTLEAFGRGAVHSESLSEFQDNWTVGVQMRWPLFTGFGISAARDQAQAGLRAMELERAQALSEARAELDEARRGVVSAARRVQAMDAAAAAASEARRLVELRFQQGLATTVDLLQAEARLTEMRAGAVDALADYHLAVARLELVGATNPENSR